MKSRRFLERQPGVRLGLGWRRRICLGLALLAAVAAARKPPVPSPPPSLSDEALKSQVGMELCQVLRNTQRLDLPDRTERIQEILDRALQTLGLPIIDIKEGKTIRIRLMPDDIAPLDGIFFPSSWTILIDTRVLRAGPLSEGQATRLVHALYHELRHVEQYYLMTSWLIDTGQTLSLMHLPVPATIIWNVEHAAHPRLQGKQAEQVAQW